ncbi:SpoIIE family protein phosphatase [Streptomyces sp. DHE7-1]|nr:SpoIIE family protein phosphatase [Streptomyces sp. DHE7-1]
MITDADGTIVMANAQVERLFGHAPAGLVGRSVVDLVPGRMRARHKALLLRYLATREPRPMVLDQGLYGLHGDGGVFPVEVSVSCSRGAYDTLVFLTARDISERRQIEEERAERYEQQRRVAYTLQHSLMGEPSPLPYLPSAHRYLASVQDPGVGGDWFDVIPLGGRRTGVVIGDVMGRGLEAAAVMGQLRAASHALARTGIEPCHLMSGLDAFVGDLADQLVTCLYLVIDQDAHEVTLCSAGHLPVVVLPAEGPPTGWPHRSVCRSGSTTCAATRCRTGRRPCRSDRAARSRSTPTGWSSGPAPTSTRRSTSSRTPSAPSWRTVRRTRRCSTGPRPSWWRHSSRRPRHTTTT